jgi:hypothetical protein
MNDSSIGQKLHKQAVCYCDKRATIQYGLKFFPYVYVIVYPSFVFLFVFAFVGSENLLAKTTVALFGFLCLFSVPRTRFVKTRRVMQEAGHSNECCNKVAIRAIFYVGRFSDFAILDDKKAV